MDNTNTLMEKPFSKGDPVPADGKYVCVPCGYQHDYKTGDQFGECMSCLSGTKDGQHEEYLEGEEMWEPMTATTDDTPTK
jgi:hypothetical protein